MADVKEKIYQFGASIVREAEARRQMINKLQMSGNYTPEYIADQRKQAVAALVAEVKDFFDGLKSEIKGRMAKIEAKYSATPVGDASAQLLAFQRVQARLKAMSADEIAARAEEYIKTGQAASVDELDLLLGELRARGMGDLADRAKQEAKMRYHAYEPWKAAPEYQQLAADLNAVNVYGADPARVYVKARDGVVEERLIPDLVAMQLGDIR